MKGPNFLLSAHTHGPGLTEKRERNVIFKKLLLLALYNLETRTHKLGTENTKNYSVTHPICTQ